MIFVKRRSSSCIAEIIEIKNLDELLQIQKDENEAIIIGRDSGWRKHYSTETRRKLYEATDGWYIEIYDDWRE